VVALALAPGADAPAREPRLPAALAAELLDGSGLRRFVAKGRFRAGPHGLLRLRVYTRSAVRRPEPFGDELRDDALELRVDELGQRVAMRVELEPDDSANPLLELDDHG